MSLMKVFVDAFKKAAAKKAIDSGAAGTLGSTTQTGGKGFEPLSSPAPEAPSGPLPGGAEVGTGPALAGAAPPAGPVPSPYPNTDALATGDSEVGGEQKIEATEVKDSHDRFAELGGDHKVEVAGPGEAAAGIARDAPTSTDYFEVKMEDVLVSSASSAGGEPSWDVKENIKLAALDGIKGESSDKDHKTAAEFLAAGDDSGDAAEGAEYSLAGKIEEIKLDYEFEGKIEDIKGEYKFEGKVEGIKLESSDPEEGGEYKFEGKIEGIKLESGDDGHKAETMLGGEGAGHKVDEFMEQEPLMEEEGIADATAPRTSVSDISFTKPVDKASPTLMTGETEEGGENKVEGFGLVRDQTDLTGSDEYLKVEADGYMKVEADDYVKVETSGIMTDKYGSGPAPDSGEAEADGYLKFEFKDVLVSSMNEEEAESSTLVDLRAETNNDDLLSLGGGGVEADELVVIADVELDDGTDISDIEV